jgi:hypothetical protein
MSPRVLYLESVAGIAGDMFTAAFLDAGLVDPDTIRAVPSLLNAAGVTVEITAVKRAASRFTHLRVLPPGGSGGEGRPVDRHRHYHYPALVRQIEGSGLQPVAREFALRVFRLLAEAEAEAHGVALEKVAFHEVGAIDSVVDVAMAGVCVESVAPARVMASPVKLGRGSIRITHGTYPVPPPASARLALGMPVAPVPEAITRANVELSTPTGLAILRALDPMFGEGWPSGVLVAQGSGAGTTELDGYPNVFRVALLEEAMAGTDIPGAGNRAGAGRAPAGGSHAEIPVAEDAAPGVAAGPAVGSVAPDPAPAPPLPFATDRVVELRCNVDDQTGERTAWVTEKALALGALDAWVEPLVGKKGRPAACIVVLAPPSDLTRFADFLLRHSSSFGVRYSLWDRLKLVRDTEVRPTPAGPVRFSVGRTLDGEKLKEKPEFEDLKRIWEEDPDFRP